VVLWNVLFLLNAGIWMAKINEDSRTAQSSARGASSAYSLLHTDAFNAPIEPLPSVPSTHPNSPDTPLPKINPMLSHGLMGNDTLQPDIYIKQNASTNYTSALERDARDLRTRISSFQGQGVSSSLNKDQVSTLLADLQKFREEVEQRKSIEEDRIGRTKDGKPQGGLLRTIVSLEEEKKELRKHDRYLSIANAPYSLAHSFTHKWTGIGKYLNMDMFKEPPASLVKEQERRIEESKKELVYRKGLVEGLDSKLKELSTAIKGLESAHRELQGETDSGSIARVGSAIRKHAGSALKILEDGIVHGNPEAKAEWDKMRKEVQKGLASLNEQADMAVANVQSAEKALVIGGAITATAITGGAAAPLAGIAVGSLASGATTLGHMGGTVLHGNTGEISYQSEKERILEDVKDSVLYSIGGVISKGGVLANAGSRAISTAGRIAPAPALQAMMKTFNNPFLTAGGILKRTGFALSSRFGDMVRGSFLTHARAGMLTELPAALYDTTRAIGTAELDPTGRLREMGVSERSLFLRQLTYRLGLAGMGGSLSNVSMGLRRWIGGDIQRIGATNLAQRGISLARRGVSEITTIPDLYAQSVLSVWSDYRLTGWFYGVDLTPTPEERAKMMRQAVSSGMAGRFASRGLRSSLERVGQERTQNLVASRDRLQAEVEAQAGHLGLPNNRTVVLASTPGDRYGLYNVNQNQILGLGYNARRNMVLAERQLQNSVMSRAAFSLFSDQNPNFSPFNMPIQNFNNQVGNAFAGQTPRLDFNYVVRDRNNLQNLVNQAASRRVSRMLIVDDTPNNQNINYGRSYIRDYVNELTPNRNGVNLTVRQRINEFSEARRKLYGIYDSNINEVGRNLTVDRGNNTRLQNMFASASNGLLFLERGVRNIGHALNINNRPFIGAPFRFAGNVLGGLTNSVSSALGAYVTVPTASIYGSWGVILAPLTLPSMLTPLISGTYRAAASIVPWGRRGTPLEVGELYTKIYEGKRLLTWANTMNQRRPGSITQDEINALQTSINDTQALFNQANNRRQGLGRYESLTQRIRNNVPESELTMPQATQNQLGQILQQQFDQAVARMP
jgi:hypothetical protein